MRAAVVALVAAGSLLVFAPAASARPGEMACRNGLPGGNLCIKQTNNGYNVSFFNTGVNSTVDFNLYVRDGIWNYSYGDGGAFSSRTWQYNSYFFAVGYKDSAYACAYSRDYKFAPICTPVLLGRY